MPSLNGSSHCYDHDPAREADRLASRRLGGLHRRRLVEKGVPGVPIGLRSISTILGYLEKAAEDLHRSEPGISKARTQVYLAATAMKAVELSDLERRLTALEARSCDSPSWRMP